MANRLSLAPLTITEAGPLELIDAASAGGFDAVTLRMVGAPGVESVAPITAAMAGDIRRRLDATGISVFSAAGIWLTPDVVLAEVEPALTLAADLGASHFLATGADEDWSRLTDRFALLCAMAAPMGLTIAVEFMPYLPVRSVTDAARLMRDADRSNGGIVVDALHLARSGGSPANVAAVDAARLSYVQLCDAPLVRPATMERREELLRNRLYPGEGELPLFALMDALPPDITIDLETPHAADAALSFAERARRAGDATRRFLASYRASRSR